MPRKQSETMTDGELRIMEILWEKGSCTVSDVVGHLEGRVTLAYTTVLTMLRILEDKGYVHHTKQGRAHLYHPSVGRDEAREGALKFIMNRFFEDSPKLLVMNLLKNEDLDPREIETLKRLLDAREDSDE